MLKIKKEKLFYIGYILMLAGQMFGTVVFVEHYINYLTYLGFGFLVIYIIVNKNKYTKKNILYLSLCTLFFVIISFIADDKKMIKLMLLIIAFKDINFESFIKEDFKYRFLFVIIMMFLSLLGFTHNNDVARVGETSIRYAFGFYHPNNFAVYTMILGLEFIYLNRYNKKISQFIFILIVFGLNYFFTDSRAAMIIEILIFIYLIIPKKYIVILLENKFFKIGVISSFSILLVFSIFLGFNYSSDTNSLIYKIDKITSGRVILSNKYMKKYSPISTFGNKIPEANRYIDGKENPKYLPLDNGYVHLMLEFGILTTIIFLYFYFISMKKLYKNKEYSLVFIVFILNLYLVMEATTFGVLYNPFLLVFTTAFYDHIKGIDLDSDKENIVDNNRKVISNES